MSKAMLLLSFFCVSCVGSEYKSIDVAEELSLVRDFHSKNKGFLDLTKDRFLSPEGFSILDNPDFESEMDDLGISDINLIDGSRVVVSLGARDIGGYVVFFNLNYGVVESSLGCEIINIRYIKETCQVKISNEWVLVYEVTDSKYEL